MPNESGDRITREAAQMSVLSAPLIRKRVPIRSLAVDTHSQVVGSMSLGEKFGFPWPIEISNYQF